MVIFKLGELTCGLTSDTNGLNDALQFDKILFSSHLAAIFNAFWFQCNIEQPILKIEIIDLIETFEDTSDLLLTA